MSDHIYALSILWGDDNCKQLQEQPLESELEDGVSVYRFATKLEHDAFLHGVEEAIDFLNYAIVDVDAAGYVRERSYADNRPCTQEVPMPATPRPKHEKTKEDKRCKSTTDGSVRYKQLEFAFMRQVANDKKHKRV